MNKLTRRYTRYAISWIYGEFRIARMQHGFPVETWVAPYHVHDMATLNSAMHEAAEHIDLSRGGDVAIAYEDDLHTHDFFDVPNMGKRDLEKLLARKVEQDKPFPDQAAWCYHEAKHTNDEEGILLHRLPKRIVDAIVRICQEYYLTPKRLVPLTEIMSELVTGYDVENRELIMVVSTFSERSEIAVTLGDGEVLFVRELPYSGANVDISRVLIDINRTLQYSKQRFGKAIDKFWLLGLKSDVISQQIQGQVDAKVFIDEDALDPLFWATEVSKIQGQISANFIPLLARKRISRNLFYRIAIWASPVVFTASVGVVSAVEFEHAENRKMTDFIETEIDMLSKDIEQIESLIERRDEGQQKLRLLQADAGNLPAQFMNHLGELVPAGLVLTSSNVEQVGEEWKIELKGSSDLALSDVVTVLVELEDRMQQPPWNITITQSWESSWYEQLRTGAASSKERSGFEITGWMR